MLWLYYHNDCSLCCEELFISYWVKQTPECKNQPDRDKDKYGRYRSGYKGQN